MLAAKIHLTIFCLVALMRPPSLFGFFIENNSVTAYRLRLAILRLPSGVWIHAFKVSKKSC
jgi:hypothetical protein